MKDNPQTNEERISWFTDQGANAEAAREFLSLLEKAHSLADALDLFGTPDHENIWSEKDQELSDQMRQAKGKPIQKFKKQYSYFKRWAPICATVHEYDDGTFGVSFGVMPKQNR